MPALEGRMQPKHVQAAANLLLHLGRTPFFQVESLSLDSRDTHILVKHSGSEGLSMTEVADALKRIAEKHNPHEGQVDIVAVAVNPTQGKYKLEFTPARANRTPKRKTL